MANQIITEEEAMNRGEPTGRPTPPKPVQEQVKWLDLRAAVEQTPPPLDFVLPGLKKGVVGALVATGGVGKTMAALQMGLSVASGANMLEFEDWQVTPGKVVYFTGEDDLDVLHSRIHHMGAHLSQPQRELMYSNFRIGSMVGLIPDLMNPIWAKWIQDQTKGARLVVLDTLRRFHKLDENDNGLMSELVGQMEVNTAAADTTTIFLHHTNKNSASGGADAQQASRGASVLTDNARFQANMVSMSEKEAEKFGVDAERRSYFVRMTFPKVNYCKPITDMWFRRVDGGVLVPAVLTTSGVTAKKTPGKEVWK